MLHMSGESHFYTRIDDGAQLIDTSSYILPSPLLLELLHNVLCIYFVCTSFLVSYKVNF